jgi:hypothetical protein
MIRMWPRHHPATPTLHVCRTDRSLWCEEIKPLLLDTKPGPRAANFVRTNQDFDPSRQDVFRRIADFVRSSASLDGTFANFVRSRRNLVRAIQTLSTGMQAWFARDEA